MNVKPFRGLRPRPDLSARIPSLPYDVVSSAEAREIAGDDPYSFLHVVRPEIDLDPGIDPHDDRVYARGHDNLQSMIEQGWMVRDPYPSYYVYRLRMEGHFQVGIVGAASVQDYLDGKIKKHEHTRPDKETDRVRLTEALGAFPGPVFLTYPGVPAINEVVAGVMVLDPRASFEAGDGIEHTIWMVTDPVLCDRIEELFAEMPYTYVADGHHRSAAAARVSAQRGGGEGSFLAVHFPAEELRVLDYNRVVRDLNGMTAEALVDRIGTAGFEVTAGHEAKRSPRRGAFGMYLDGSWYLLSAREEAVPDDLLGALDVSILSERVLGPLLGIRDPRTDERIDFVGGIRGMEELERRVDSGAAAVAFALYPTSLDDVMRVADAGEVMPPKSTWFEPKLRSGLVVQLLD